MSTQPRLLVEIATSLGTFQSDFSKASGIADQHARKISKSLDDIQKSALGVGKSIALAIGIPLSIGAAIEAYDTLRDKAIEGERAVEQLNAVLRATGGA